MGKKQRLGIKLQVQDPSVGDLIGPPHCRLGNGRKLNSSEFNFPWILNQGK